MLILVFENSKKLSQSGWRHSCRKDVCSMVVFNILGICAKDMVWLLCEPEFNHLIFHKIFKSKFLTKFPTILQVLA